MRISDWSSDVCSSDLYRLPHVDSVAGKENDIAIVGTQLDFRVGVIISAFALKLDGERLIDFFRHGRGRGDARLNEISHDPAIGDDLSLIFGQRIFGRKTIKRLQPATAATSLPLVGLRFKPRTLAPPDHCVEPQRPVKFGLTRMRKRRFTTQTQNA